MSGWYVTHNDIQEWVARNKKEAEGLLPLLVEKLVRASSSNLTSCEFPCGDAVSRGGYDGVVAGANSNSEYMFNDDSVWEIGTDASAQDKANTDFDKRSENPLDADPGSTCYVHVSPRAWTKARKWEKEKNELGIWKDVRAINSVSLSSWLYQCPAVHRWFSRVIGKRSAHLWDCDQAWEAFVARTQVQITPEFLLYEREKLAADFREKVMGIPSRITLASEEVAEPYGFLLAALKDDASINCRLLIVKDQVTWDDISEASTPLILMASGFTPQNIGYALSKGHHCIVFDTNTNAPDDAFRLPRLNKHHRCKAIETLGFTESESYGIMSDTLGYFSPLCRSHYLRPVDQSVPSWVNADLDILIPVMLCFEWDESNENDQSVLEVLSGRPYAELAPALTALANEEDPFIRKVGSAWQVLSRMDAWFNLKHAINKNMLVAARESVINVVAEIDPASDLPVEEQYMAAVKGKSRKYSGLLRNGLGNTLALLSISDDDEVVRHVNSIVVEILEDLDNSAKWWSLGRNTRLLCEAHPGAFLSAFERQIEDDPTVFISLFDESDSSMFGSCKYSELLWSLEILAGSKIHFSRAVLSLASLASIDPGTSTYANSPLNTLGKLFLGRINVVQATHEERLVVLEKLLLPRYPNIAWKVLHGALARRIMTLNVSSASYRDWSVGLDRSVTEPEYYSYCVGIADLLVRAFESFDQVNPDYLHDVLESLNSFNREQIEQLAEYLTNTSLDELEDGIREKNADQLRHFVARHRSFSDAQWAAPEEIISLFENAYLHFMLDDVIIKSKFLFSSYHVDLIHPELCGDRDYKIKDRLVKEARLAALEEIYAVKNCDGIVDLLEQLDDKQYVGHLLADVSFSSVVEPLLLTFLEQGGSENGIVARHYVSKIVYKNDDEFRRILEVVVEENETIKVELLLCASLCEVLFSELEKLSADAQNTYWTKFRRTHLFEDELSYLQRVVERLTSCNRFNIAIDVIASVVKAETFALNLDPDQIASLLCMLATVPDSDQVKGDAYGLCDVIKYVQDSSEVSDQLKRQIEWYFVYSLQHLEFYPRNLVNALKESPEYFVQLVGMLYKSKDEAVTRAEKEADFEAEISEEEKKHSWKPADALLDIFKSIPGRDDDEINAGILTEWVNSARILFKRNGRSVIGDQQIGQLLATSPSGTDGLWPHEVIRDLIETVGSDAIETGIDLGAYNSRGGVTKAMHEGGAQERALEQQYVSTAEALQMSHPRTSRLLRGLAGSYADRAKRSDNQVELRR